MRIKTAALGVLISGMLWSCSNQEPAATAYKKTINNGNEFDQTVGKTLNFTEKIYSADFGLPPNENIDGKSLFEIVTSQKAGRDDGQECAICHNNDLQLGNYWVPTAANEALDDVDPTTEVAGRAWAGDGGWAERFVANTTKPSNVKLFIQAWIDGGYK